MTPLLVAASFAGMEAVSYLAHRFLMHGPGWKVHKSHHQLGTGGFERNDLYPLGASSFAIAAFALGTWVDDLERLVAVGIGMTLYGLSYLFVHEVYIHERLGRFPRSLPALEWLKASHRLHHVDGGEPYGMLVPLMSRSTRQRAGGITRDPLPRGRRDTAEPAAT